MKRKLLYTLLCSVFVVGLVGCAGKGGANSNISQESIQGTKDASKNISESEGVEMEEESPSSVNGEDATAENDDSVFIPKDYTFNLDGVDYHIPCKLGDILKDGWSIGLSGSTYILDKTFATSTLGLRTKMDSDVLDEQTVYSMFIKYNKNAEEDYYVDGLKFGEADIDDVKATIGEPDTVVDDGASTKFVYSSHNTEIYFKDGILDMFLYEYEEDSEG